MPDDFCCTPDSGDCCGPGSWCCARAGKHTHDEDVPRPIYDNSSFWFGSFVPSSYIEGSRG